MTCPKCGAQNMDGVTFCGSCGAQMTSFAPPPTPVEPPASVNYNQPQPYQQQPYTSAGAYASPSGGFANGSLTPPKNYMTESILVTVISFLCCCSPISLVLGIIAIVKANNVNSAFAKGNINEANKNAASAKTLAMWAAIVAGIMIILNIIMYFVIIGAGISGLGGLEEILKNIS